MGGGEAWSKAAEFAGGGGGVLDAGLSLYITRLDCYLYFVWLLK